MPLKAGEIVVERGVKIHYETFGDQKGRPIFILHGGPGSNIEGLKGAIVKYLTCLLRITSFFTIKEVVVNLSLLECFLKIDLTCW